MESDPTSKGSTLRGHMDAVGIVAFAPKELLLASGSQDHTVRLWDLTVPSPKTRAVLGIQGFGSAGDALVGRVGAVAALMQKGCTADDLSVLEYPYSPPFSSAMDIVNTVGTVAENMLAGMNQGVSPEEFARLFEEKGQACFFLDCREPDNAAPYLERHPGVWHNIPQGQLRERLDEIPRDKAVVLVCNTGIRSYEAQITLEQAGFKDVLNLHGGMAALKQSGEDPNAQ